jgi:hypothetical protein
MNWIKIKITSLNFSSDHFVLSFVKIDSCELSLSSKNDGRVKSKNRSDKMKNAVVNEKTYEAWRVWIRDCLCISKCLKNGTCCTNNKKIKVAINYC